MSSLLRRLDCRATALIVCALAVLVIAAIGVSNPPLAVALMAEDSVAEWLQVVLLAATGGLAARQAWLTTRAGQPAILEVAIVTAMVMSCVSEVDLDRLLFGTKIIATRFFVNPRYPLALRALTVLIVVGVPAAVGVWLLTRWRQALRATSAALREPWGQTAAFGAAVYAIVQALEGPIDRFPWQQHHMLEEMSELIAAACMFIAVVSRERS